MIPPTREGGVGKLWGTNPGHTTLVGRTHPGLPIGAPGALQCRKSSQCHRGGGDDPGSLLFPSELGDEKTSARGGDDPTLSVSSM